ncbi:hypothetical protein O6H91_01G020900 [Diphasiastrum complanatum]|uniref:Uncharacterized protein n=3 Tax=Diphasiastrum complanatum TaxID=34168 RepID=A0ACC2ENR8_DIPCM|nr:hypothetical protein O6H91_01G020900 [Diphasiastrum complanatum]KAJ7568159.1 hypothetical protein O6H91_01G020900 [Diphasiastrum complanatum]KAJ7568161.1 hypothetical protein O6H91_01G020900 [Diphasiastrum complanatum]
MKASFESRLFLLLLYITFLHAGAIFFFTRGFLLTRTELSHFSLCHDAHSAPCAPAAFSFGSDVQPPAAQQHSMDHRKLELEFCSGSNLDSATCTSQLSQLADGQALGEGKGADLGFARKNAELELAGADSGIELKVDAEAADPKLSKCWTEPAVKRVVIMIIDALRFDFVAPSTYSNLGAMPWMNKLKILQELVDKEAPAATFFKFISDPPTTTLQRLKGLMTGGLPTFIDIGHSFGAPAIVEDNLILQLKRMGKRVVMMGDDTWLQLFPNDLAEVYPFPSFNVKDLHTVDNGVIKELFPALHRDNWDVLIAHFLGVDHVGHIFGVESPLMVEKLEQYNAIIEKVISLLRDLSKPGSPHEDTLLIIMGDHGQTLNGDHGGGTAEEVETALFAMSMRKPRGFLPQQLRSSPCNSFSVDSGDDCISTLPQLDFAPTLAALLGLPFPFGSVGRVNPELYALSAGTWPNFQLIPPQPHETFVVLIEWLERYLTVLCINSWQVKRYFEVYEASALSKFPAEQLSSLNDLYVKSHLLANIIRKNQGPAQIGTGYEEFLHKRISNLTDEILSFSSFLKAAGLLARSQWTQFGDVYMAVGVLTLIVSVAVHAVALQRLFGIGIDIKEGKLVQLLPVRRVSMTSIGSAAMMIIIVIAFHSLSKNRLTNPFARSVNSLKDELPLTVFGVLLCSSAFSYLSTIERSYNIKAGHHMTFQWLLNSKVPDIKNCAAILFVIIHACSLLSNSFILSEGQVASFLLASLGLLYLRHAIQERSKLLQAIFFLCLNRALSSIGLIGIVKDAAVQVPVTNEISDSSGSYARWDGWALLLSAVGLTSLPLILLSWMLRQHAFRNREAKHGILFMPAIAVPSAYTLIIIHWLAMDLSGIHLVDMGDFMYEFSRLQLPRMVYATSIVLTFVAAFISWRSTTQKGKSYRDEVVKDAAVALVAAWSPTIILLVGRKGPLIACLVFFAVQCLVDLQSLKRLQQEMAMEKTDNDMYSVPAVDWNFLAILLFFCTGHRCTFDGLRYPAAFIGFDDFNLYRQGALLAIDTFGLSHVLPILGIPLLVAASYSVSDITKQAPLTLQIGKAYLSFGMMRAVSATFATICAALQRRHLMVWGLFAPKYVFDAIGLLVTDVLLVIATLLYCPPR